MCTHRRWPRGWVRLGTTRDRCHGAGADDDRGYREWANDDRPKRDELEPLTRHDDSRDTRVVSFRRCSFLGSCNDQVRPTSSVTSTVSFLSCTEAGRRILLVGRTLTLCTTLVDLSECQQIRTLS